MPAEPVAERAARPRVFPRILIFIAMTVLVIVATVQEVPGMPLGILGAAWVGALLALVHATQGHGQASPDSGSTGGDGGFGGGDGGDGGGE